MGVTGPQQTSRAETSADRPAQRAETTGRKIPAWFFGRFLFFVKDEFAAKKAP